MQIQVQLEAGNVLSSSHRITVDVIASTSDNQKRLYISLVYADNNLPVTSTLQPGTDIPLATLIGDDFLQGVLIDDAHAQFKIKLNTLSSQHNNRTFRFKITGKKMSESFFSPPFKSLSKSPTSRPPHRKRRRDCLSEPPRKCPHEEHDSLSEPSTHLAELSDIEFSDILNLDPMENLQSPLEVEIETASETNLQILRQIMQVQRNLIQTSESMLGHMQRLERRLCSEMSMNVSHSAPRIAK